MRYFFHSILLILVFTGLRLSATPGETYLFHRVHEKYFTENGLPQNSIYAVTRDKDGFIWIGTAEGLARFDGHEFRTFGVWNTDVFTSSHISSLLLSDDGTLWAGTKRGGIVVRDRDGSFSAIENTRNMSISSMALFGDNSVVVGTYGNGLHVVRNGIVSPLSDTINHTLNTVYDIAVASDGTIWVGTDNGAFSLSPDGTMQNHHTIETGLADDLIRTVYIDDEGAVWLGTSRNGISRLRDGTFTTFTTSDGLLSNKVFSIAEDPSGRILAGTANGLVLITDDDRVVSFSGPADVSSKYVRTVYVDRDGNLWAGTFGYGLHLFRKGPFTTFTTADGLSGNRAFSLARTEDGTIWAGTYNSGLNRRSGRQFSTFVAPDLPNGITALRAEGSTLFAGTYASGIFSIDTTDSTVTEYRSLPAPQQIITVLARDSSGVLWSGGYKPALMKLEGDTFTVGLPKDTPAIGDDTVIRDIFEKKPGTLWLITDHSGIFVLRDGTLAPLDGYTGLPDNVALTDIYRDSSGTLRLGSSEHGIITCDTETRRFIPVTKRDGLESNTVHKIIEDDDQSLWLTTNAGIINIPITSLNAFINGETKSVDTKFYTRRDGIRNPECVGGLQSSAMVTENNKLWFSTISGIAMHDPAEDLPGTTPPDIVIERAVIDGSPTSVSEDIILRPYDRDLDIYFTAPFFADSDEIIFRYTLRGFDTGWHTVRRNRRARYTNLPPGEYTFLVQAVIPSRNTETSLTSLYIRKNPRFYETAWFIIFMITAVSGIAVGTYRMRTRKIRAVNHELSNIIENKDEELREVEDELQQKYSSSSLDRETIEQYKNHILSFMKTEKPYFDEDLNINRLADMLEMKSHHLSQIINSEFDKNFYTFVNRYRVEAVKKMLLDPENRYLKILAIAYDCGFKSKSSFNTVFKRFTGSTPSQFRKQEK